MWTALKGLFSSKTLWLAIVGSGVITALAFILPTFGLSEEVVQQVLTWVGVLFGIKGGQQGLADMGKNKSG